MKMKESKEWFVSAPWGKLALISWGNPAGEPVLLVHGHRDSAATFVPLLELLPDTYYYVGFDLPGNGKSDSFPQGVQLMKMHFVAAIEAAIEHLNWSTFIYLGHSLGSELGLFYNIIHPGKIKKFIHLDVGLPLQRLDMHDYPKYMTLNEDYYKNYYKINNHKRVYSKKSALEAVMKARKLTEKQAEIVLSRNLICLGEDSYMLTWERRLQYVIALKMPKENYLEMFSKNCPPTLVITALNSGLYTIETEQFINQLLIEMEKNVSNFKMIKVKGGHDVHLTNPERIESYICYYLMKEFDIIQSKL